MCASLLAERFVPFPPRTCRAPHSSNASHSRCRVGYQTSSAPAPAVADVNYLVTNRELHELHLSLLTILELNSTELVPQSAHPDSIRVAEPVRVGRGICVDGIRVEVDIAVEASVNDDPLARRLSEEHVAPGAGWMLESYLGVEDHVDGCGDRLAVAAVSLLEEPGSERGHGKSRGVGVAVLVPRPAIGRVCLRDGSAVPPEGRGRGWVGGDHVLPDTVDTHSAQELVEVEVREDHSEELWYHEQHSLGCCSHTEQIVEMVRRQIRVYQPGVGCSGSPEMGIIQVYHV